MPYPGQPKDTPIPPALDRWNWGAFFLNWVWGLGNSTYIALLMFVPVVNIVMIFVLGAKGSQWAWKNRIWADEAHFVKTQRNWARAGLAVFVGIILLSGALSLLMKSNGAYRMMMSEVRADTQAFEAMGEPIEAGWFVMGQISVNGSNGHADLTIPVSGPKCSGKLYGRADKAFGVWEIYLLVVHLDCNNSNIVLINDRNLRIPNVSTASGQKDI